MERFSDNPVYNINVVIQETGLKEDTLRAWERRYGLPKPSRSVGGHRLFSEMDIETIKWLLLRLEEGMRIGQAVELWKQRQNASPPVAPVVSGSSSYKIEDLRDRWVEACLRFDDRAGDEIVRRAFATQPAYQVCDQIFRDGLVRIGELWYQNIATVQQEHFAAEAATRQVHALINAAPTPWRGKTILIGAPAGERHVFPNLLLNLLLRDQGYGVFNLGADVPIENLKATIQNIKLDLIISSAAHVNSLLELKGLADAADEDSIRFAYGGRVFVQFPQLVEKIPGTYLGNSLDQAIAKVEQSLNNPVPPNFTKPATSENQAMGAALAANQGMIALKAIQSIKAPLDKDLSQARWPIIASNFNRVLVTAVILDDLQLVNSELDWVRRLIEFRGFSRQLFKQFIEGYIRALAEVLGESGAILGHKLHDIIPELGD